MPDLYHKISVMKFLTPEIEALAKEANKKSLIAQGSSCGIFQDCDPNNKVVEPHPQLKTKKKSA